MCNYYTTCDHYETYEVRTWHIDHTDVAIYCRACGTCISRYTDWAQTQ